MRRFLPILFVTFAVAACQGMSSSPPSGGMMAAEASDASTGGAPKTDAKASIRVAAAAPSKPAASEQPVAEPTEPFRSVTVSADALAASLIVPLPAKTDSNTAALEAERDRIDRLIAEGGVTREAGAKRLYRLATKNGFVKGKADETLWQTIIQAYRNLDDRYITLEDAASDIAAAFQQRREAK
ncbi:MAG: hypothetical protein RLZZ496_1280 [Pseudomonadota bacterium]